MSAVFSPNRVYRYTLTRLIPVLFDFEPRKFSGNTVMFIGLNPSTADEQQDDPTIRRCIGFAQKWGFTRLVMTNLFAFRATDPKVMKAAADPIGCENDHYLLETAKEAGLIVACWGNHGGHRNRSAVVKGMIPNLWAFKVTAEGEPQHPLYLAGGIVPKAFN